jgi:hypothetical protein
MRGQSIAIGAAVLLGSLVAAWWSILHQSKPIELIPTLSGQPEYCLTCHENLREISASHPVKVFGCVSCHGGERLAVNADLAHSTMRGGANPSDLSVVQQSCGGDLCHSGSVADQRDHIQRVTTSVQATYAGAIASILYTFGAQADLRARFGITAVTDDKITTSTGIPALQAFDPTVFHSASIGKFGGNCLKCHINATPIVGPEYSRFTGCAACHSPLSAAAGGAKARDTHVLTTAIPYTQCDACHNRGNYDLRSITFVPRADHPVDRLHDYYQPIAQFTKCEYTLDCVDCHTRTEAMGDGDIHSSKKEIQYIQCKTCHGTPTQLPKTSILTDPNAIAFRQAQLNPVVKLEVGDTVLVTDKGEPLWNTQVLPDGNYELVGKATGQVFKFRPVMGSGCSQNPAQQASQYCHECHSTTR